MRVAILLGGLGLAVVLLLGWPRGPSRAPEHGADRAARALGAPDAAAREASRPELPVPVRGAEPGALAIRVEAAAPAGTGEETRALPRAAPDAHALVDELAALHAEAPERFAARAPARLAAHLAALGGPQAERDAEQAAALRAARDGRVLAAPVHGALTAALGALLPASELLDATGPGRAARRGAWLGATADWPHRGGPGLRLEVGPACRALVEHGAEAPLELTLVRPPQGALREALTSALLGVGRDHEEILDRYLAALALGTAVDHEPEVLALFVELLFDETLLGRQVRLPLIDVLCRSDAAEARAALEAYLRAAPPGDLAADRARARLAERGALPLAELLAPLEAGGDPLAVGAALGALGSWLKERAAAGAPLTPAERDHAQGLIERTLAAENDPMLRTSAVAVLAFFMDDGVTRLHSLRRVLEVDADPGNRRAAILGLARTRGELRAESRALLAAWAAREGDPELRAVIAAALADDG